MNLDRILNPLVKAFSNLKNVDTNLLGCNGCSLLDQETGECSEKINRALLTKTKRKYIKAENKASDEETFIHEMRLSNTSDLEELETKMGEYWKQIISITGGAAKGGLEMYEKECLK